MMKLPAEVHTSVACFSRICHESVLVQLPGLVVGSFQDGGASHRSLGGRDQGEVLARNSQQNLPASTLLERAFWESGAVSTETHIVYVGAWSRGDGEKNRVDEGELLVDQAPPDGSLVSSQPACRQVPSR